MNAKRTLVLLAAALPVVSGVTALFILRPPENAAAQSPPTLILYSEEGFQGRALVVTGSLLDLPVEMLADGTTFDWNDNIRSLRVLAGTWRLYQHGRFNTELDDTPLESLDLSSKAPVPGWSCLVSATSNGPAEYPSLSLCGCGQDVSSIELLSPTNLPDWAQTLRTQE